MKTIRANNLTKIYKHKTMFRSKTIKAVDNLSFSVEQGKVLGLIGPNGAGKTTTLKMLIGYTACTKGDVKIFGRDIIAESLGFRHHIGYLPEETYLPGYQKAEDFLAFIASLFNLNRTQMLDNVANYLEIFGLKDKIKNPIAKLSMGQRRLVGMIQALINKPKLLFLDEPTVYLDPVAVESFNSMIRSLKAKGHSVIISSHILTQMQDICDEVLIMHQGKRKAFGKVSELTKDKSLQEFFINLMKEKQ